MHAFHDTRVFSHFQAYAPAKHVEDHQCDERHQEHLMKAAKQSVNITSMKTIPASPANIFPFTEKVARCPRQDGGQKCDAGGDRDELHERPEGVKHVCAEGGTVPNRSFRR